LIAASAIDDTDPHVYSNPAFNLTLDKPASVDLRPLCSPVDSQGILATSASYSFAAAIEFLDNSRNPSSGSTCQVSRLFAYYNERILTNAIHNSAGVALKDGIVALTKHGVCSEANWPFDPLKLTTVPDQAAYDAASYRIGAYARVLTLDINSIKAVLASNYPVVISMQVFDSFEGNAVAASGIVQMPLDGERQLGGHATLIVGYDDITQRVIARNSWGASWGQGGYFTLPYAYVTHQDLTMDAWVINTY